jgi:ketopantoate hydroxymethyltransferase
VAVMGHVGLTPQSVSVLGESLAQHLVEQQCALHACSMTQYHCIAGRVLSEPQTYAKYESDQHA